MLLAAIPCLAIALANPPAQIDFNRDVRPILADRCFGCHGPDEAKRKAGLRLDTAEGAAAALKSGHRAIVPGKLDESEAAARIRSADPDVRQQALVGIDQLGEVARPLWSAAAALELGKDEEYSRRTVERIRKRLGRP